MAAVFHVLQALPARRSVSLKDWLRLEHSQVSWQYLACDTYSVCLSGQTNSFVYFATVFCSRRR